MVMFFVPHYICKMRDVNVFSRSVWINGLGNFLVVIELGICMDLAWTCKSGYPAEFSLCLRNISAKPRSLFLSISQVSLCTV